MLLNAFIIVWRESLEAMLVIGILAAWAEGRGGSVRAGLWSGVAAGGALALALSAVMQGALGSLSDRGQEIFQALLILFAAALMTHMVLWMRRHARGLRRQLHRSRGALARLRAPSSDPVRAPSGTSPAIARVAGSSAR